MCLVPWGAAGNEKVEGPEQGDPALLIGHTHP